MAARIALLLAAACPGLARSEAQKITSASRVCVKNSGGFDMSFDLWNTASNSLSSRSPVFSSSKEACLDLSFDKTEPGSPVVTVVHAATGMSHSLPPVLYSPAPSGGEAPMTANFSCAGAAEDFSCKLDGEVAADQPGTLVGVPASEQMRAGKICVQNSGDFRMTVRLWDTATGAFGDWSPGFDMWEGGDGSTACVDPGSLPGVATGHPLVLVASPQGTKPSLVRSVLYDPDVKTPVLVECWGGRQKYSCEFRGAWRRLRGASAAAVAPMLV